MKQLNEEILVQAIDLLQSNKKLDKNKHTDLLTKLEKIVGSKIFTSEIILPNNEINIQAINKHRKSLLNTLICIKEAADYEKSIFEIEHTRYNGKKVKFKVNNKQIYQIINHPLNALNFEKLFALAKENGVFNLSFSHHLPAVTINAAAKHMTRKWPRDHMGMIPLIADCYPEELWPGIEKQAEIYSSKTEVAAFERVFKNLDCAKQNLGVAHVFFQNDTGTVTRDRSWKMNQRIESHGEVLKYMAYYSKLRLLDKKDLSDNIIKTIVRFTHYLYIQGTSPQSCGPWEEIPFSNGINWDNASIIGGFQNVMELIDTIKTNDPVWQQFVSFENDLCKKFKLQNIIQEPKYLKEYIGKSLKEIRKFYCSEFRGATNRSDASSTMLAAANLPLCSKLSLLSNIKKHLKILRRFERNLVHQFGAWRYNKFDITVEGTKISSCDSYLNLNYYNLCDCNGGIYIRKQDKITYFDGDGVDASALEQFTKRSLDGFEKATAQWGLPLSYAALAFNNMASLLLQQWKKDGSLSEEELKLLEECMNSSAEYIKRSYGNITGCKPNGDYFIKADGNHIGPWRKPEAYQAVSKTFGTKEFVFLPGVNDHLGWDAAKCYEASKLFLENLYLYENLSLNTQGF